MKIIRKEPPKPFPYQHPTFGTEKKPKTPRHWEDTVYFLWWAYLKRSETYLKVCENKGKGQLSEIYKDFGDVRGDSFKIWWNEDQRGATLFANNQLDDQVRLMEDGEVASVNSSKIIISIPLSYPQRFLMERVRKLISSNHKGEKGIQYARDQSKGAKYKFKGQPNVKALKIGLAIYDLAKAQPNLTLWELGLTLPQFQTEQIEFKKNGELPFDIRRTIASTVSRYKKRVADSIKNVGKGVFP